MYGDAPTFCIRRITLVLARIGGSGRLDQQERCGGVTLFRDDRHTAARRIIANDLRTRRKEETKKNLQNYVFWN
jgi:hypothetical protein